MKDLSPYEQMQVQIHRMLAQTQRMEVAALSLAGHPYEGNQEEIDYWRDWHMDMAERYDHLADEIEEK